MADGDVADLKTGIVSRGYATDTGSAQTVLLNSVYQRIIGMRRWPFLEVGLDTTLTCTVGDADYALSGIADLLHPDAVRLELGTDYYELEYIRPQQLRSLEHRSRDSGVPAYWTRLGGNIRLWPAPDRAYDIVVDYVRKPPTLDSDDDLPVTPVAYKDVLVWGAIAELCFRERDMEGYGMAKAEYGTRLVDMMNEYGVRQRQNNSQVVSTGTYDHFDLEPNWAAGTAWPAW